MKHHTIVPALFSAVFLLHTIARPDVSNMDSLPFFYQRTAYLENLFQPAAWWANPALISGINKTTLFTPNVGLLGGKYAISSIRIIVPVKNALNAGFGVTGSSTRERRGFSGSQSSGQLTSNYHFSRPSLEAGASLALPKAGTAGALMVTGTESIAQQIDSGLAQYYFFWGGGFGYLSPALLKTVQFSFSTMSICHFQAYAWWDNEAKAGIVVNVKQGLVLGSAEYAYSLDSRGGFWDSVNNYEVIKADVSIRFRAIAGLLLGFSSDTRNFRDNGSTFHTGVELRRSELYPYWGGYEIGVSPFSSRLESSNSRISLIHHFWVGYSFIKKQG
jgi:hypothetical protein